MPFSLADIPFYSAEDPPVILVTGGTTGIGAVAVRELARHGARVYVTARSEAKASDLLDAMADIKNSEEGHENIVCDVRVIKCDMMSSASVIYAAKEFQHKEPKLEYVNEKYTCVWRLVSNVINIIVS